MNLNIMAAKHYPKGYPSIIEGHVCYGIHQFFRRVESRYVVFLRDPVERVISQYTDQKEWKFPRESEFDDFIVSKHRRSILADNMQVRMLAGIPPNYEKEDFAFTWRPCTKEMLESAKQNLMNCWFVGYQEQFKACVDQLIIKTGWSRPKEMPHRNKTTVKQPATPKQRAIIARQNQFDIELYEFAKKHFPMPV
jgi:hypothetical protein